MFEINKTIEFEAAHFLREYKGKCEKLHGHRWKVMLGVVFKETNKIGISYDFTELKKIMEKNIHDQYDHMLLNEIPPFDEINPSAENIAKVIYHSLKEHLPAHESMWIKVWESPNSCAKYWE